MVYSFRVGPYARCVYLYGIESFQTVPTEYYQPVKGYASKSFSQYQIDQALQNGYITQQDYDETILLIPT